MRKVVIACAMVSALALAGCSSTTSQTVPATPTPSADQAATATPDTTTPPVEAVTADSISAKLTAAGLVFVTKDKTAAAQAMESGSGITKSTEFKVTVPGDIVSLSVIELTDASQRVAVEGDLRKQFATATGIDPNIKAVVAKMNTETAIVGVIYKVANEKDAWKVEDAIGAE